MTTLMGGYLSNFNIATSMTPRFWEGGSWSVTRTASVTLNQSVICDLFFRVVVARFDLDTHLWASGAFALGFGKPYQLH